jgi:uncharacterized protein (TIGR03437 family)
VFLTYLGGTGNDLPYGLAEDASGNIYVGGQTISTDFPLAGTPWQPTLSNEGTFLSKLSASGASLIWSTVLNGNLILLALGPDGSVYYLSQTTVEANGEVTTSAALTKLNQNGQFVANFNVPSATSALAVGPDGSVYIGGSVGGPDSPPGVTATPGAWQTTYNGGSDGFVAKMNSTLSGFAWLTFVGGTQSGFNVVNIIEPAPDGTLWITGTTSESDFPVLAGALQSQLSPGAGFLVHLSADGSKALASSYLPSSLGSLALDGSGNLIFSGNGQNGFQATPGSQWPCQQSVDGDYYPGFFGKIDSSAQHLLWDTWAGSSVPIGPVAVNNNGNAVAAGNVPGQQNITLTAMTTVPGPPRLVESCIAQSASPNETGPLAPGEIFSIYGAGFGPEQGVAAQPSGNTIGTQLAGVQVLIEDTPAPLLYASSAQINLVAPYLLDGRTAAHIKIVTADSTSNEVVLGVRQAMPEIFQTQPGAAALLNQDGTLNSQANPAHVGDTVSMFVSGVGQTNPPGMDGAIPQAAGGAPVLPIQVQLNFVAFANVTYAGNAPGLVSGVTQVNFQIPQVNLAGAGPPYPVYITLYAGEASSGKYAPVIWID